MHSVRFALPVLALALLFTAEVRADLIGLDFTGGSTPIPGPNPDVTLGWDFTLTKVKAVTALGLWDEGSDGLGQPHQVGIWLASGGAPLAVTTITNASTPVASTESAGRWLFETLSTPVILWPGTYVLGAYFPTPNMDLVRDSIFGPPPIQITTAPDLTFGHLRFTDTPMPNLAFPNRTTDTGDHFGQGYGQFGPDLLLRDIVVPEPAALGLSVASLLCFQFFGSARQWVQRHARKGPAGSTPAASVADATR